MGNGGNVTDREDERFQGQTINGKDEMNLAEFPFASLRKQGDDRNVIEYEGWATDESGNRYQQKWVASGSAAAGLPTEYDERVFVALMAITARQGFDARKVPFSIYQVLKILGLGDSKRDYESLERSLERLVGVTIYSKDAFWDNDKKRRLTTSKAFHILDKFWLRSREGDDDVREEEGVAGYIVWGEDIWRSFKAGYIKNLDLHFFYQLENPTSRRLYRFLDKRMHYRDQYEIDIFELAGRLGMVRYQYPSKVLEKLQPALDELIANGFLISAEVVKVNGYTRLRFVRTPREGVGTGDGAPAPVSRRLEASEAPQEALPASAPVSKKAASKGKAGREKPEPLPTPPPVVAILTELGLSPQVAKRFANRYQHDYLMEKVDYLTFLQTHYPQRVESPRGWLRHAIEEDYGPPDGYLSPEEHAGDEAGSGADMGQGSQPGTTVEVLKPQRSWRDWVADTLEVPATYLGLTEQLQANLRLQMTEATYQSCVATLLVVGITEGLVHIAVPSYPAATWITKRLRRPFEETLSRLLGRPALLDVEVMRDPGPEDDE